MNNIFVTGTGTGVGKTVVSAILVKLLEADYWKPVQTGTNEGSDTNTVKGLVKNDKIKFHKESFTFVEPVSPHYASALEEVRIKMKNIELPKTEMPFLKQLLQPWIRYQNKISFQFYLVTNE